MLALAAAVVAAVAVGGDAAVAGAGYSGKVLLFLSFFFLVFLV